MKKIIIPFSVAILIIIFAIAGYLDYQGKLNSQKSVACTMDAKACPDGSFVGRIAPNCEFAVCPEVTTIIYKNDEYGFELTLPLSWKYYVVTESSWNGTGIDSEMNPSLGNNNGKKYTGPLFIFDNPRNKSEPVANNCWQNIPIMVFTPDVWTMVSGNNPTVAVSAAPFGPEKIGENAKYVFALPPRWAGFACNLGIEEAQNIVKTFKAL